jgi:hypothetical protein
MAIPLELDNLSSSKLDKEHYCGGERSSSMSSAGTSNKNKDKIRNTQRREIVGTDRGTKAKGRL